jgi:hypothetical protein
LTQEAVNQPSAAYALVSYAYNAAGQVSQRTFGGTGTTIVTDYGYNGVGQTTTINAYTATRKLDTVTYAYDVNTGLVKGITRIAWRTQGDPYYNPVSPNLPPSSTQANQSNPDFSSVITLSNSTVRL